LRDRPSCTLPSLDVISTHGEHSRTATQRREGATRALIYSVLAWKNSYWGIAARVHYTMVTVAAVAFVWFLNYWNLLGWRF
jgi:hypothetical protein